MEHDLLLATEIPSLDEAVARGALLDVMPSEVRRILALVGLEGTRAEQVEGLLVQRPSLATAALHVARRACAHRHGEIADLQEAIAILGYPLFRAVLMGAAGRGPYAGLGAAAADRVWTHVLGVAAAGRRIALAVVPGAEDLVYLAGLLHDAGKAVLHHAAPGLHSSSLEREEKGEDAAAAEERTFGYDHAAVGARVLARWGLPALLVEMVAVHHSWEHERARHLPASGLCRAMAALCLADRLCRHLGIGTVSGEEDVDLASHPAVALLGLPESALSDLVEELDAEVAVEREALEGACAVG